MAAAGLRGTELGAPGFLPSEAAALRDALDSYGLRLAGAFVPVVLHRPDLGETVAHVRQAAALLAAADAQMMVVSAVEDLDWSAPQPLSDDAWRRMSDHLTEVRALAAEQGVTVALHPHAGSLIETAAQIERALGTLDVPWCLDTGHLLIGGVEPLDFVREHGERIVHVHLKDVDARIAREVRDRTLSLLEATRAGLFVPLGRGDARIWEIVEALDRSGYDGWFVLEQDTAITEDEPTVQSGPMLNAKESIAFLQHSAPTTQEVH
jgi:inosose dehydratase